jgi:hypothetical protein
MLCVVAEVEYRGCCGIKERTKLSSSRRRAFMAKTPWRFSGFGHAYTQVGRDKATWLIIERVFTTELSSISLLLVVVLVKYPF